MTTLECPFAPASARRDSGRRAFVNASPTGPGRDEISKVELRQYHRRELPLLVPPPAEEAAWQVLKPFINPADCNHWVSYCDEDGNLVEGVRAMNRNDDLAACYSREPLRLRYLSKRLFVQHCRGQSKYYYRCRWNAIAETGFGGHANAWRKLPFDAARFAMNHRKVHYPSVGVMLLGFDIDCHHGERDVLRTTGLIHELLPGAYDEPSTNGLGRHLYVKLQWPAIGDRREEIRRIQDLTEALARHIEVERWRRGYDAALDGIRGLPTLVEVDRDEHGVLRTHAINQPDGSTVQCPRMRVAHRPPVIKIPFYRNCSMDRVERFFDAPWYGMDHLVTLMESVQRGDSRWPDSQALGSSSSSLKSKGDTSDSPKVVAPTTTQKKHNRAPPETACRL